MKDHLQEVGDEREGVRRRGRGREWKKGGREGGREGRKKKYKQRGE